MYSGRHPAMTPLTAMFQTVAADFRGAKSRLLLPGSVCKFKKLFDSVNCRGDHRETVGPLSPEKKLLNFIQCPAEDDLVRFRFFRLGCLQYGFRKYLDDILDESAVNLSGQFFIAIDGYDAGILGHRQVLDSKALTYCLNLFQKSGGDDRC